MIYADPPWRYNDSGNPHGGTEAHYESLTLDQIKALNASTIAAPDAVLFVWATYPLIREALEVIDAWGFTYKTLGFQWVKTNVRAGTIFTGLGRMTRGNTEPCLLATRGKPKRVSASVHQIILTDDYEPETIVAPVTRHSAKPPEARTKIVELLGDVPRIELFARERAAGWDAWGNQLPATTTEARAS